MWLVYKWIELCCVYISIAILLNVVVLLIVDFIIFLALLPCFGSSCFGMHVIIFNFHFVVARFVSLLLLPNLFTIFPIGWMSPGDKVNDPINHLEAAFFSILLHQQITATTIARERSTTEGMTIPRITGMSKSSAISGKQDVKSLKLEGEITNLLTSLICSSFYTWWKLKVSCSTKV